VRLTKAVAQLRAKRRASLRCEPTRKDAIFLRTVTFDWLQRRFLTTPSDFVFIRQTPKPDNSKDDFA